MRERPGVEAVPVPTRTRPGPLLRRGNIESDTSEGGFRMVRELRCADLIPGCDFVAQGTRDSGVLHVARDAMQQIDSGRSHAGKYVAWHQAPPSRSLGRDRPCDLA